MNRLAVVLAADSATTVTTWINGEKEERYFKGANKVYQLSNFHPVGVMIFDGASMLNVPWEVIIKDFRKDLGKKSHNSVRAYADEFFKYIVNNVKMFPPSIQHEYAVNAASSAALGFLLSINTPKEQELDGLAAFYDKAVQDRVAELRAVAATEAFGDERIERMLTACFDDIKRECDNYRMTFSPRVPSNSDAMAELGVLEIGRRPKVYLDTTGIVFAGFGDDDVFPTMIEYEAYGLIASEYVVIEKTSERIDYETPASLNAFAQTSMADTFTVGFGLDAYLSFNKSIRDGLQAFTQEICSIVGANIEQIPDIDERVATKADSLLDEIMSKARQEHALPLRRVLGALPVDEMAELAETLINLQSLKEESDEALGERRRACRCRGDNTVRRSYMDSAEALL